MQINEASKPAARSEQLILVDEHNRAIGHAEKWSVHREARLHRAFSIFLVDAEGRMLLQQRSREKYHSGGLWANSCCGHPRPGERTRSAARRRLGEELGCEAKLRYGFRARYRTELPNGLTENEIVYVFFGATSTSAAESGSASESAKSFTPNPAEVAATTFMTLPELKADIDRRPARYAYWLRYYLKNHFAAIRREVEAMRDRSKPTVEQKITKETKSPR